MAVPIWPSTLPQVPLQEGLSEDIQDPRLVYDMDKGNKTRITGHLFPEQISVTYALSGDEYTVLKNFVKYTLSYGVKAFDYPHPLNKEKLVRAEFVKTGNTLIKRTYFKNSLLWQAQFTLRIYDYAPLS